MTRIQIKTDCGNSPKMTFLKDFNISFAKGEVDIILARVTEDISWNLVGHWSRNGLREFLEELKLLEDQQPEEMVIDHVVSHGKQGAVNGILTRSDGKKYAFADFYEFKNAKGTLIKSITTYMIPLKD